MINLSKRLSAVAALVERGSAVADIGTDHGYIPVYLFQNGIIKRAVAADINSKPLSSCRALVKQEGLGGAIEARISDGLDSLRPDEYDTVIIAGMGGEMIADILSRAESLEDKHIILNPMTHPEIARKFLYDNGYEIFTDIIVADGRYHYSVFDARYTGKISIKTKTDYFLGNITDFSDREYFLHLLNYLKNKEKSGEDLSEIINAVENVLQTKGY